jgi:pyruvate,water dikinase
LQFSFYFDTPKTETWECLTIIQLEFLVPCLFQFLKTHRNTDLDNQQVDEFLADVNKDFVSSEIKGSVASKTGAEKIIGKVRVLKSANEARNMQQGEILVTSMTSPDFVSAMRKAICIITDEGGVTSHAAIVSRELRIPAIIGTKIATQVLKDGDLVEVDSTNGLVKILEKAKETYRDD